MRKLISVAICIILVILTTACNSKSETLNEQYASIITEYEAKYGTITTDRDILPLNDALGGVSYVELVDFDGNGTDELLIIFDQNTKANNPDGALTCHIYAEADGTATLVYNNNLAIADIRTTVANTIGCDFKGRTLCFTSAEGKTGLLEVRMYTEELEHYPLKIFDSTKNEPVTTFKHSFLEYKYLYFNGTEFVPDITVAVEKGSPSSNLFLLNGDTCSEITFNESKKPVTGYVEASTYYFSKCLEQINSVKATLGMEKTVPAEYTPTVVKPQFNNVQLHKKYGELLKEYKGKYGTMIAYVDLIDFNKDGFDEFLVVYGILNETDTHHYSTEKHIFICEIFGAQATEIVNIAKFNLPVNDYRGLMGKTLWLAEQNGKTYLCNYMNYTLYMPEEGLSDFKNVDDNYHQFFTADCYYTYNGEKFVLDNKYVWQGERDEMITMINDERCPTEDFHKYQQSLDTITKKVDISFNNKDLIVHNEEIEKELNT